MTEEEEEEETEESTNTALEVKSEQKRSKNFTSSESIMNLRENSRISYHSFDEDKHESKTSLTSKTKKTISNKQERNQQGDSFLGEEDIITKQTFVSSTLTTTSVVQVAMANYRYTGATLKVHPLLSSLVNYIQPIKFPGFEAAERKNVQ